MPLLDALIQRSHGIKSFRSKIVSYQLHRTLIETTTSAGKTHGSVSAAFALVSRAKS